MTRAGSTVLGLGFEGGEDFGVAHIDPAALDFHAGDAMAGLDHGGDGVSKFIFTAGGFFEFGGEVEEERFETVDSGVVPSRRAGFEPAGGAEFLDLRRAGFFDEPGETELVIEEVQAAFGDIFALGDGEESGESTLIPSIEHGLVGVGADENVAVGEEEVGGSDEVTGIFWGFAGAVLSDLAGVGNLGSEAGTVAEVLFDGFGFPAGDDAELADADGLEAGDDMFEDGPVLNLEHGFRDLLGEVAHAGAFAGSEDDSFHGDFVCTAQARTTVRAVGDGDQGRVSEIGIGIQREIWKCLGSGAIAPIARDVPLWCSIFDSFCQTHAPEARF